MRFTGWPPEALAFFEGLEADNSKAYWSAHRDSYDTSVRAPMEALAEAVAEEFGPLKLFRPYRDVRFSKDKTPYKTHVAAVTEGEGGTLYYVQVSAAGLYAGAGMYHLASDQLERYRAAVAADDTGPALVEAVAAVTEAKLELGGDQLKTTPRGWPKDHARIDLLRRKGLIAGRAHPPARWLHTAKALDRVLAVWRGVAPLGRWLDTHVGPSTLPPPEPR